MKNLIVLFFAFLSFVQAQATTCHVDCSITNEVIAARGRASEEFSKYCRSLGGRVWITGGGSDATWCMTWTKFQETVSPFWCQQL